MKYRKKPALVDAWQWWKHGDVREVTVIPLNQKLSESKRAKLGWLETPQGGHIVFPGDWVIIDHKGQISSCNPVTFKRIYEIVEERILPMPNQQRGTA